MSISGEKAVPEARAVERIGKAALIESVGGQRGYADWTNPDHRLRRLLAEFIGMAGLTFVLSGGAAVLARYGGHGLQPWQTVLVLSAVSALWLVVAVYFLGDISAHFNPATTLAFTLRRDMDWVMAGAVLGDPVRGRDLRDPCWPAPSSGRRARWPPRCPALASPGRPRASRRLSPSAWCSWSSAWPTGRSSTARSCPLAVGAYIMAWGTMGGPFDGASMNPARSFGPDVAIGNLSTWWVYLIGPVAGAVVAVGVAHVLRGRLGAGGQRRRGNAAGPRHLSRRRGARPPGGRSAAVDRPSGAWPLPPADPGRWTRPLRGRNVTFAPDPGNCPANVAGAAQDPDFFVLGRVPESVAPRKGQEPAGNDLLSSRPVAQDRLPACQFFTDSGVGHGHHSAPRAL